MKIDQNSVEFIERFSAAGESLSREVFSPSTQNKHNLLVSVAILTIAIEMSFIKATTGMANGIKFEFLEAQYLLYSLSSLSLYLLIGFLFSVTQDRLVVKYKNLSDLLIISNLTRTILNEYLEINELIEKQGNIAIAHNEEIDNLTKQLHQFASTGNEKEFNLIMEELKYKTGEFESQVELYNPALDEKQYLHNRLSEITRLSKRYKCLRIIHFYFEVCIPTFLGVIAVALSFF